MKPGSQVGYAWRTFSEHVDTVLNVNEQASNQLDKVSDA
jgi:hypothetical protein